MVSRLVLGDGAVGQQLVDGVTGSTDSVQVISDDADRVQAVREESVPAERGVPTDPEVLAGREPDVVVVADEDPARARAILRAVREAHPGATVVAYASLSASEDDRAAIAGVADRVVDASESVGTGIVELVASAAGTQMRRLRRTIQSIDGRLAVVTHDNPDPDAIASAVALCRIAEAVGVPATPCYYGEISHQENRALVNLLELDMRRLDDDEALDEFGGFALVDHSRPGVNDQLPPDLAVDVVLDHHPPRAPVEATFVDLRSEVGATSTLLTNYLRRFGIEACGGATVATALLYGIRVDTDDFVREVSPADFEAAATLVEYADTGLLDRIESPAVSPATVEVVGRAIRDREVQGAVLASCVGRVGDRDALAQAADRLLAMDGITTTIVYGYTDGEDSTIYASARARGTTLDLGETLRLAFEDLGSAGGHADMAGAQIPLSALGADVLDADPDERERIVRETVSDIFFDAVSERPHQVREDISIPGSSFDLADLPADWDPHEE